MDREERKQKRKKDTQKAVIMVGALVLLAVALICAAVSGIRKMAKKETPKQDTQVQDTQQQEEAEQQPQPEENIPVSDPLLDQANQLVGQMTLEQKVAQMFFITPEALAGVPKATKAGESTKAAYLQYPVGGIIYQTKNLIAPEQVTEMLANMKAYSQEIIGLPVFLGVNEEGGTVTSIASNSNFGVENVGNMSDIGAFGDVQNAYNAGSTIGAYLNALGFNLNFAPAADVLSNPDNTVLKERSFGSDSQVVADMACAVMQALNEQHILSVVKHFPGQGASAADTNNGAVSVEKSYEELLANELIPFQQAINQGASFVMVGHVSVPAITGDSTPSSLSSVVVTDILRNQMGFQGIIITDAMNMGAVKGIYSSGDAAVAAINAGVDMILMPDDFNSAYQAVLDAAAAGTISEQRINESVARIIKVKLAMQ